MTRFGTPVTMRGGSGSLHNHLGASRTFPQALLGVSMRDVINELMQVGQTYPGLQRVSKPPDQPVAWKGCGSCREGLPRSPQIRRSATNPSDIVSSEIPPRREAELPRVDKNRPFHAWSITGVLK